MLEHCGAEAYLNQFGLRVCHGSSVEPLVARRRHGSEHSTVRGRIFVTRCLTGVLDLTGVSGSLPASMTQGTCARRKLRVHVVSLAAAVQCRHSSSIALKTEPA